MKPILFNTEMVRAILDGRKTQTRRVVKLKYSNTHLKMHTDKYGTRLIEIQNEEPGVTRIRHEDGTTSFMLRAYIEPKPPYRRGDILYVRETWSLIRPSDSPARYVFKATDRYPFGLDGYIVKFRWHPSIHMPKEAARLFLRVTDVRVEQLRDITRDGAISEGCNAAIPILEFQGLWDSTIKPTDRDRYGWDANPWVWVICFERCEKPEVET